MERRDFLKSSGVGLAAGVSLLSQGHDLAAAPSDAPRAQQPSQSKPALAPPARARYTFQIDIVEGDCPNHKAGQTLKFPDEQGKICPWLMDAMSGAVRVLQYGGTLPWLYKGTPYEKVIDPEGLTTEFIRCPDPTRAVVAKISRRRV